MARWLTATRDGDIGGGDFPAWLVDLFGTRNTTRLADRRGECIYSACSHYHKCFVEKTVRRAKRAEIVVANHALVLAQTATGGMDDGQIPTRLVFDEGHHLFDAADSAFSAHLSGQEGAELRRWLLGPEEGRKTRTRGLRKRIEDVASLDDRVGEFVDLIIQGAHMLPGPAGPNELRTEHLEEKRSAFSPKCDSKYTRERRTHGPLTILRQKPRPSARSSKTAVKLSESLDQLIQPMRALSERLMDVLDESVSELDTALRNRIESVSRSLRRRTEGEPEPWRSMLEALTYGTPKEFVIGSQYLVHKVGISMSACADTISIRCFLLQKRLPNRHMGLLSRQRPCVTGPATLSWIGSPLKSAQVRFI